MAGRGRGRGRGGGMPLNLLNLERGEKYEPSFITPPPDFPDLRRTMPLTRDGQYEYPLKVRLSLQSALRPSPYYVKRIVRVLSEAESDQLPIAEKTQINMDWTRFPKELQPVTRRVLRKKSRPTAKRQLKKTKVEFDDIAKKLAALEGRELTEEDLDEHSEKGDRTEGEDDEDEEKEGEEGDEYEEVDEEDLEEGTDYADQHFDNGEGYLEEEEDNLDDLATF